MLKTNPATYEQTPKSSVSRFFQLLLDGIMNFIENIDALLLGIMTLIIFWQVITRFKVINILSPWTEEIALMLLVWFGLTGAAIGIRKNSHIGVEFVTALFPKKIQKYLNAFVGLLIACFSAFLFFKGIDLVKGTWNVMLSATLLPRGRFVYLAIPISAFLMFIYSLEFIIKQLSPGGDN